VLYEGALANMAASFLGGYPFWLTYNYLNRAFPVPDGRSLPLKLAHRAVIGFCSTAVSGTPPLDTASGTILKPVPGHRRPQHIRAKGGQHCG